MVLQFYLKSSERTVTMSHCFYLPGIKSYLFFISAGRLNILHMSIYTSKHAHIYSQIVLESFSIARLP